MGKGNRRAAGGRRGAGDAFDTSDSDSISTMSTGLSDLTLTPAMEQVDSQEFILDKYIDALYEKRGSTRETALSALVDAFESFVLLEFVDNKCITLLNLFLNSIKKGSIKEACLASRAIALLSITLGEGTGSHEILLESLQQLSKVLQVGSEAAKTIAAVDCLACVAFVGASDLAETESSLKAMWDVIHPKSGANVATAKKPRPEVLVAAISAWSFLLTTIRSWRVNPDNWKEQISFLSTLLDSEHRPVRIAAGEAFALCFELKLLEVPSGLEDGTENVDTASSRNKLFLQMQAMKAKISGQVHDLSMEAGGKGADKKNLNYQRDVFQKIWDFVKNGEDPEEEIKISNKLGIIQVSSWSELIQLNFLKQYLGKGFLKHAQDNQLLHEVFNFVADKADSLSSSAKKIYRLEEEKERAQKLNRDRRLAQQRKQQLILSVQDE